GSLVQGALGRAVGGALDPAVWRVRRGGVDSGYLQRAGADPGPVAVTVGEVHGPAACHLVEKLAARRSALEPLPPPAAARDPFLVVELGCVGADPGERVVQAGGADQAA